MLPAEKCLTSQRMGPWAGMSHHHTKRNDVTIPPGADLNSGAADIDLQISSSIVELKVHSL